MNMNLVNIEGKQYEFLSIYNSSDGNIAIYISSNDRRDYTSDMQALIDQNSEDGLTVDKIIEGLDIAVLISKDEAIKQLHGLITQIERWKKDD